MISKEENQLLCWTGPGTAMGDLFRRFWLPVALSRELPKPDCPPLSCPSRLMLWLRSGQARRDCGGQGPSHRCRSRP